MDDERNIHQIIRKDARNCFVETLSDFFEHGKVHFCFASYDMKRPVSGKAAAPGKDSPRWQEPVPHSRPGVREERQLPVRSQQRPRRDQQDWAYSAEIWQSAGESCLGKHDLGGFLRAYAYDQGTL